MKQYYKIPVLVNGVKEKLDIEQYTRGGTMSPTLTVYIRNGKRLVPYAARQLHISQTYDSLLHMYMPVDMIRSIMDGPMSSCLL